MNKICIFFPPLFHPGSPTSWPAGISVSRLCEQCGASGFWFKVAQSTNCLSVWRNINWGPRAKNKNKLTREKGGGGVYGVEEYFLPAAEDAYKLVWLHLLPDREIGLNLLKVSGIWPEPGCAKQRPWAGAGFPTGRCKGQKLKKPASEAMRPP